MGATASTDQVAAVVDAADAVDDPDARRRCRGLTIVHSPSEDAAVLLADDVPVPEGDRVYELWAIRDGTPERFATFRPDADGTLSVYAAGLDPASAEAWAITEEPAGGSDTPTPADPQRDARAQLAGPLAATFGRRGSRPSVA